MSIGTELLQGAGFAAEGAARNLVGAPLLEPGRVVGAGTWPAAVRARKCAGAQKLPRSPGVGVE